MDKTMQLPQNMGMMDRIVRGIIGGALFTCGALQAKPHGTMNTLSKCIGGAFVLYSLTGWDPLLSVFKSSTKPGDKNNVLNKLKPESSEEDINNTLLEESALESETIRKAEMIAGGLITE